MRSPLEAEVHVWTLPLMGSQGDVSRLRGLLSKEEEDRIERQVAPEKRVELAVAWGQTRRILASYIGCSPHHVPLSRQRNGKPIVEQGVANGLTISLAHSFPLAQLAVASRGAIGVDVERLRRGLPVGALAARFFALSEQVAIASLREERRTLAFFRVWARKEAYLKGVGVGVPSGLCRFAVTVDVQEPPRIVSTQLEKREGDSAWALYDLDAPPGYVAALATEGEPQRIVYRNAGEVNWS
jgi:4'-phosphopantetheinyl transferase